MVGKFKSMVYRAIGMLLVVFIVSCEDNRGEYLTPNKIYFPNSGITEVHMYDFGTFGEDVEYRVGLYKSGIFDSEASVTVRTLTSTELASYDETGELELLPANSYVLGNTSFEFGAKERNKYLDITFLPDVINDALTPGKQPVLALLVEGANVDVTEDKSIVILAPKVTTPVVYFEGSGVINHFVEVLGDPLSQSSFTIRTNFDNEWSINGTIEVDPAVLDAYNQENGTSFPILPAEAYSFNNAFSLSSDQNTSSLTVTFNRDNFPDLGRYILPLTISSVSQFGWDEERSTILVDVNYGGDIVELNSPTWTIAGYSSQQPEPGHPASAVLDNNFGTMWQPRYGWCDNVGLPAPCVAVLPHYVTIDMQQTKGVTRVDVHRRSGNFRDTRAGTVHISADNVNWTEIGTYRFPTPGDDNITQAGTGDLSVATGRYVRVVVTESLRANNANITEIKVFGPE